MPDDFFTTNIVQMCLERILENSPRKDEYANQILNIVRTLNNEYQELLNLARKQQD